MNQRLFLTTLMLGGVFGGMFVETGSVANATTLDAVKQALSEESSPSWQAAESKVPVALRTPATFAIGGDELDDVTEDLKFSQVFRDDPDQTLLPSTFDWRSQNGVNYMPPVKAQGECGSCVAFASVATLESSLNIACGSPGQSFDLSEQYVFSCGGGRCGPGWRVSQAVDFLGDHGVPDRSCLPYGAADGTDVDCNMACADADERLIRGVSWTRPTTGFINITAIKRGLMQGPLLANMILFEDLEFYDSGVYRHVQGDQIGGHAVVLVGWDDADSAWIVRNSWGPEWGDGGYFKVAWDDVSLPGRYTWLFAVEDPIAKGICSMPR